MRIFVSHTNKDNTDRLFCDALVKALHDAGSDVWYDEHNLGPGEFRKVIEHVEKVRTDHW
jgi:hypothetical protein